MEIKRVAVVAVFLAAAVSAPAIFAESALPLRGSIVNIDLVGRKMDIRSQDGKIVTVPVDPTAKITLNGQNTTFSGLSVGQAVTVQRTSRNGQSLATSIEALPAAPSTSGSSSPSSSAIPQSPAAPGGNSSFPASGASPSSAAPSPGSSLPGSSPSSSSAGSMGSSSPSGS